MKLNTKGVIEEYRERYDRLVASGKAFRYDTYTVNPGSRVMVHIKVPSETVDDFYYDVLFELGAEKSATDFRDCDIKIFSNCPSFVFSVAYVFAHWDPDNKDKKSKGKGMMIDSLKGKLPRDRMLVPGTEKSLGKEPVHEKPVVRNPMGIPLFDKSIYFAIFYMLDKIKFAQAMHNYHNISMVRLMTTIDDFDKLMEKRKKAAARQAEKKKRTQAAAKKVFEEHEENLEKENRHGLQKPKRAIRAKSVQTLRGAKSMSAPKQIGAKRK